MESWREELENKLIELYWQNECYKQRADLLSTDWLRAAQRPSAIGVVPRREFPKRLNSQLNSTRRRVELNCVAINGALMSPFYRTRPNIRTNLIPPETRLHAGDLRRRQYVSIFISFHAITFRSCAMSGS